MSINLTTLFSSLGIVSGNTSARNQFEFYYGIEWSDGTITYNQFEFFTKIGLSRFEFFNQYISEYDFYRNTTDPAIYDYKTFYENAGVYLTQIGGVWILNGGIWNDLGVWDDSKVWID